MTTLMPGLTVEERLDRLSTQVEEIATDLRHQRESREQWQELTQTLVPVSRRAFDLASRELADLSDEVTVEDAIRLARTLARMLPQLERLLAQVGGLTELGSEVTSLGGAGLAKITDLLAGAEHRGYFAVARGGASVMDRVVTSYAEEDFEVLGDHLVQLLSMARRTATPEVMGLLDRMMLTLRESQSGHLDPPSALRLLKQLHAPQTRRGMASALALLQAVGAVPNPDPATRTHQ